jgi:hypothetical protein
MANAYRKSIEELFWPDGFDRNMWMIVDGARDRHVYSSLLSSYLQYSCLYAGDLPHALEAAAPYLVQLEFEDRYTRKLIDDAWGNSWGIFLRCTEPMEQLRRHLRQFLRVQDWKGRYLVFRYYDPRVMRVYLPTCNREEIRTVFGPIKTFYIEDEDPSTTWDFGRDAGNLAAKKISLAGKPNPVPAGTDGDRSRSSPPKK